ncbi:ComEC/Rec2 family competence protein [Agromyces italicus]|uniref:ComEC/Rec2 family competence protein n=1 Tax=Agromyces italicus TaxID=279572 RepID=UPI0003B6802B|nr:ComEC/Rec2 family competence protein [Agromyces italicus]
MRDARLVAPAVAAWAAAWVAVAAPDAGISPWTVAAGLWGLAVILLLTALLAHGHRRGNLHRRAALLRSVAATASIAAASAALVASSAGFASAARNASPIAPAAETRSTVEVVVELTSVPRAMVSVSPAWSATPATEDDGAGATTGPVRSSMRIEGRLVRVDGAAVAPVPVSGAVEAVPASLQLGALLAFTARASPEPSVEASAYRLSALSDVEITAPPAWLAWSAGLRTGFADAATRLGGDGGALVPGLAIGDTSAVGEPLDAAMKASSLSHLTAVSGANCAIVTAAAFALAAALGLRRSIRVIIALLALGAFVVLVTPESSVVRAAVMAVVVLIAVAAGRPGGGLAALALAVVVLLVVDPWYARDYGFALSVCATAGLLVLAGPLSRALARVMPVPLAVVLGVPLAAQLACQPVLVLLDPAIAVYGVPANLLAAPAAPIGTVVGLIGCLLLPVLPSLGYAAVQFAWLPAQWIAVVAHTAAALPAGRLPWLPDAPGALLLAVCTVLVLRLVLGRPLARRARAVVAGALIVAVAIQLGVVVGGPAITRVQRPRDWVVAACDVGQGDAVLLRPGEATALIDTGPDPAALTRCLELLGVDRIDLLVLTHWDADHVGGVAAVEGIVSTVLHGPLDGERSSRALDPLVTEGAEAIAVTAGSHGTLGRSQWRALWPMSDTPPGNDGSVVLEVLAPSYHGVFLGDLGEDAQRRMLTDSGLGPVDLVKVAHHGSADQREALYERLGASVGLIGVGADNGYGHPTGRLLELLERTRTMPLRTDLSGTIALSPAERGMRVWSERGGGDGAADAPIGR